MKSLEVDRLFLNGGWRRSPSVSGSPRLAMTTIATIATMATPIAERLKDRVFGKRNASATKIKTTIHSIASIFIRASLFRAAIMLNPTICCRQRCKLWGIDVAIGSRAQLDLMHAPRARHDPHNSVGPDAPRSRLLSIVVAVGGQDDRAAIYWAEVGLSGPKSALG